MSSILTCSRHFIFWNAKDTMRNVIVGTAGHVDHGKTCLIKALTGIDADRLKEEKQRGITIELGFADMQAPDGTDIGIIDVYMQSRDMERSRTLLSSSSAKAVSLLRTFPKIHRFAQFS